ncbi:hypothetical protein EON64_16530 [archaeon]|nr:MAG: hypothetical protein EON64_16530 [archaeon]
MADSRPDIFAQSVLVLSQCDTLSEDFYPDLRDLLRPGIFGQRHPDLLFGHVVGVINKFNQHPEPHTLSYHHFTAFLKDVQDCAKKRFGSIFGVDCDVEVACNTLCTTAALFQASDAIVASLLHADMEEAAGALRQNLVLKLQQLYETCHPPARYYLAPDSVPFQHMCLEFKKHTVHLVQTGLDEWFKTALSAWTENARSYLGLPFSLQSLLGCSKVDERFREWLDSIKEKIDPSKSRASNTNPRGGIAHEIKYLFEQLFTADRMLLYHSKHAPRRFPVLAERLRDVFLTDLSELQQALTDASVAYVDSVYDNPSILFEPSHDVRESPTEKLLAMLLHKVLRGVSKHCIQALDCLPGNSGADAKQLLEEDAATIEKRQKVHAELQQLSARPGSP